VLKREVIYTKTFQKILLLVHIGRIWSMLYTNLEMRLYRYSQKRFIAQNALHDIKQRYNYILQLLASFNTNKLQRK